MLDDQDEQSSEPRFGGKYHRVIEINPKANIETVISAYKNEILETVFNKKADTTQRQKVIKVK
ncbi:MAG TPA: hypothetical protein VFS97_10785 [Nitrososphaeraceae archaeon]|nr:hypothetical protein [Nitrososphaeraceae archaeon]